MLKSSIQQDQSHLKGQPGMDGKSKSITEEKLEKLKEIIPEAFSEDKIDWEKLKAAIPGYLYNSH